MMSSVRRTIVRCVVMSLLAGTSMLVTGAERCVIASGGEALCGVVVGGSAGDRTRAVAGELARYLGRMSGADFAVGTGDGRKGIAVGLPTDFAEPPPDVAFEVGPFGREDYVIRSTGNGIWLLGATELAVEHAVWDLLWRLGCRQFFPGPTWEVVPERDTLAIALDARESPDFHARRIWYNWGMRWGYNQEPYRQWCARNRAIKGFDLNSGHSYSGILGANRKAFDEHPEYFGMVKGERRTGGGDIKFCIANPGLRELVVDHAVGVFRKRPDLDSISMDPSDGDNWCECVPCTAMGSPSDRALTLANEVADAINSLGLGQKYVGMYAYNRHSPPPSISVHPNVIVSATTAFIRGGFTFDQIVEGWQARGATIGVYDYFSVVAWDWNMPRRAKSARPGPLAESIRRYHKQGARFFDAESGDAWGPYGLGFYIASRVLWDVSAADRVDELVEDFLTRAFGPAKEPMRAFYMVIGDDGLRRSDTDLLARMYRHLKAARELAKNHPDVRARVDDLIVYARYAELYDAFAQASGDAKSAAKTEVIRFCYRIRKTMMVHSYGLWARLIGQKAAHTDDHPMKHDDAIDEAELLAILREGIRANVPVETDFTPVTYSEDLVPAAAPLRFPQVAPGNFPPSAQDRQTYLLWVDDAPGDVTLKVTVQHVWDLRPHGITMSARVDGNWRKVAESDIVRPDGKEYTVVLRTPHAGLHRIETRDGGDYTRIVWPQGMPVAAPSAQDTPGVTNHFRGKWGLYFYVPKATAVVAGWASRIANWAPRMSGTLCDADGNVRFDFGTADEGWFSVPVPDDQDGRLWSFHNSHGQRLLVTVPPYLARTGDELLLPREVVQSDWP